jgi:large subunit ribosomal protein L10
MSKYVKEMLISDIRSKIGDSRDMLILNTSLIDAVSANKMRLALRKKQIQLLSVKNTLAKKALSDAGITSLDQFLNGPTTLVWGGEDVVALSKEIAKWAKDIEKLEIKGGTVEGTPLTPAQVDQLSKSPSREELLSQLVGLILSPGAQLSAALLGAGAKLGSQIKKIADKEGADQAA